MATHGLAAMAISRLGELVLTIDPDDLDPALAEEIDNLRSRLEAFDR